MAQGAAFYPIGQEAVRRGPQYASTMGHPMLRRRQLWLRVRGSDPSPEKCVLAAAAQGFAGAGQVGFLFGEAEAQEVFATVFAVGILAEEG